MSATAMIAAVGIATSATAQVSAPASVAMLPMVKIRVAALNGGSVSWPGGECAPKSGADSALCTADVPRDRAISFTANAGLGRMLARWSGACGDVGICRIVVTQPTDLVATFRPFARRLTVRAVGGAKVESIAGPVEDADLQTGHAAVTSRYFVPPGAAVTIVFLAKAWQAVDGCDTVAGQPYGKDGFVRSETCKLTMDADRTVSIGASGSGFGPQQPKLPSPF